MLKLYLYLITFFLCSLNAFAQKPSKEQMEADKKRMAEAQKKLNETMSQMSPEARRLFDSTLNKYGGGQKMNDAINQVNNNSNVASAKANTKASINEIPAKDTKRIAAITATPSASGMGAFVATTGKTTFSAVLPAAKKKADEIYKALKSKGTQPDQMGNAAITLWMAGRSQIALSLMAQVCDEDPNNTDNLGNYASMLTMMGAPELAIPILNNLNGRFKKNSTILNNLGQAWFALGDMDKAGKYLDSTLLLNATHAQANETRCLIDESKGNKTAAISHAKIAFKQGNIASRKDKLTQLGYTVNAGDYNDFPPNNKSADLLNLGNFSPMEFPKSYAAMKAYEEQRKQFLADIDAAMKPLQKATEESNKEMLKQLEEQQKQFMEARNKAIAAPGSVSQSSALQIVNVPMFSEKMNAKENMVLQNLQQKKNSILQKMADFRSGEGAAYKKEYDNTMKKINARWKNVGEGGSEDNGALCNESVKAADTYLNAYNTKAEELYNEYLIVQKQFLNEMAYSALYTTYPKMLPGIVAGLKKQWLTDLSFKAEVLGVNYGCSAPGKIKSGKLTEFKDPKCNINSELKTPVGSIKIDCSGITTTINAGVLGVTLNQDLDHEGFGDSFQKCTISVGPKAKIGAKMGLVEVGAKAGAGVDIEIDRTGVKDVAVTGSIEAEASILDFRETSSTAEAEGSNVSASAGMEGRISLNTGRGSINGTGIFGK